MRGVRPVDEDSEGLLLDAAVAEHAKNFNVGLDTLDLTYRDTTKEVDGMMLAASISGYLESIAKSNTPIFYRTGWQDSGTAEGALCLFNSLPNPIRVMIGPWDHGMSSRADPYQPGEKAQPLPLEEKLASILNAIEPHLASNAVASPKQERILEYYTYGEDKWKKTTEWPIPEATSHLLYLSENHSLKNTPPTTEKGQDIYKVDTEATTGAFNRWHTQTGGTFVNHPDRQEADKKLLVYDSPPLEVDTEVTGHPLVRLFISSTASDGTFFAYLEDLAPDGRVRLISEGYLRALHRKVSDDAPPYWMPAPYHSFKKEDAAPMEAGAVTELVFNLLPTSVLFRAGHRIRLAIAGADKDTFALVGDDKIPEIRIERNSIHTSYLALPIVSR